MSATAVAVITSRLGRRLYHGGLRRRFVPGGLRRRFVPEDDIRCLPLPAGSYSSEPTCPRLDRLARGRSSERGIRGLVLLVTLAGPVPWVVRVEGAHRPP
jgi:hypothetical protein